MTPVRPFRRNPLALALSAALSLGFFAGFQPLAAQLLVEGAKQSWRAGETVVLVLERTKAERGLRLESVLVDDRSVPFEVLGPGPRRGEVRLRLHIPQDIRPGSHAVSVLYAGPVLAEVPEVRGLTLEEARRALRQRGLDVRADTTGKEPSGEVVRKVVAQRPRGGTTAPAGSRVAVEVLLLTRVPDIVGLGLAEAARRVEEQGLRLGPVSSLPEAVVVDQNPAAGATARTETPVAVTTWVTVPDLAGQRIDLARDRLFERGLRPLPTIRQPGDGPYEAVLEQRPVAGRLVPPGTGVEIAIEALPDPPPPPWPWLWLVVVVLLAGGLGVSMTAASAVRPSYHIETHRDLDHLHETATPKTKDDEGQRLGFRLLGHPDPGQQSLHMDNPPTPEETRS
jgi:hypothetical protein